MSAPGSPQMGGHSPATGRRGRPAAPMQLFPTSYVDLNYGDGAEPGATTENPHLPLPSSPLLPVSAGGAPHHATNAAAGTLTQQPQQQPYINFPSNPSQQQQHHLLPPHPQYHPEHTQQQQHPHMQPHTPGVMMYGTPSPVATPPTSSYSPTAGDGVQPLLSSSPTSGGDFYYGTAAPPYSSGGGQYLQQPHLHQQHPQQAPQQHAGAYLAPPHASAAGSALLSPPHSHGIPFPVQQPVLSPPHSQGIPFPVQHQHQQHPEPHFPPVPQQPGASLLSPPHSQGIPFPVQHQQHGPQQPQQHALHHQPQYMQQPPPLQQQQQPPYMQPHQQHTAQHQFAQPPQSQERQYTQPQQSTQPQPQYMQSQAPQFYSMPAAGGGAFDPASGGGVNESAGQPSHDMFADASAPSSAKLGAESYEPIFEDTPTGTAQPKQQNQRGNRASEAEDDDDYMGLYNKPKPVLPPVEQARGDDSSVSSLFATSASSLRQRRGGSASENTPGPQPSSSSFFASNGSQPAAPPAASRRRPGATGSRPATHWHWPWVSRLAGLILLAQFISLGYRHVDKDGLEGLVDLVFTLQVFILAAAVGMLTLSPTLIGTSLVVLSYYHFSWWADLAHWLITGAFFFGTAVPVAHISWDSPDLFALVDLSYHALFLPLCFLALYKNGGVRWRAGFLSIFLHSLLFLLSTTHPLPVPSLQGHTPLGYRSANLYEQTYKSENSPPYRAFMEQAPQRIQQAAENLLPLLEEQGIHVNLERDAPEQGGGIIVPSYIYPILWIVLCNLVSFVLLKVLSFILLQRGAQGGKKKKAE